jgi:hypothetical protein
MHENNVVSGNFRAVGGDAGLSETSAGLFDLIGTGAKGHMDDWKAKCFMVVIMGDTEAAKNLSTPIQTAEVPVVCCALLPIPQTLDRALRSIRRCRMLGRLGSPTNRAPGCALVLSKQRICCAMSNSFACRAACGCVSTRDMHGS